MIHMQQNLNKEVFDKITFLTGDAECLKMLSQIPAIKPFDESVVNFLNDLSKNIMSNVSSRTYSDVITFAFWIRKASVLKIKEKYNFNDKNLRFGRGAAFHIAPSNVPVNFAYSLVSGLITGNSNVVRIPSKDFMQTKIIVDSINKTLLEYENLRPYIVLVRYERDRRINDALSYLCDTRIVWGGDATIAEIRKSELPARSTEILFSDRYSLAIINSDKYMELTNKERFAEDFYNDTYFTDQNACTSPRMVVWIGNSKEKAKKLFWENLHNLVSKKYTFQPIQSIDKLVNGYLSAIAFSNSKIENSDDNLIVRVKVSDLSENVMELMQNSGFFFEYDCDDIMALRNVCNDKRCQTVGLLGDSEDIIPLIESGIKGVDRIVPIGKTMDFNLIWDGYDLFAQLTRIININC